jgi:hypothetical protein
MSGVLPPLLLYAFKVWAAKNFTFALPQSKHIVSTFVFDIPLYYDSIPQKFITQTQYFFKNNRVYVTKTATCFT